jgi:hypothetical protein
MKHLGWLQQCEIDALVCEHWLSAMIAQSTVPIYDMDTAIRAFQRRHASATRMTSGSSVSGGQHWW